ncbi:putative nucleotidyltransferase [Planctomycetes bacterium Pla163]|uniref:Putative nucleotidyltransferase n=1 Tax=Rohdeia mirabilis TaxID=2528008 RepID=A0A518CVD1_9BACT|nr:putative nucleotidyltransferase [Planctomycetes bacterium Pla163]
MQLSEGTRVVLKVPGAGAGRVHPVGAVAVVVSIPSDSARTYRLRFEDGDEANFTRGEFARLVDAQDPRQGGARSTLEDRELTDFVVLRSVVGSRAYGLSNDASDEDVRGIYLPPTERTWSLFDPPAQLEESGTADAPADEVFWELRKFLLLALKANPNILEVLCTPLVLSSTPLADELRAMRSAFFSKLVYQTYSGYVLAQFKRFERRSSKGLEPKWKHAMHLLRLQIAGAGLMETGDLRLDVEGEEREKLLEIRAGAWSLERVDDWRAELTERFERAFSGTSLPDRPDYERVERFLVGARRAACVPPASLASPWRPSPAASRAPAIDELRASGIEAEATAALQRVVEESPHPLVFATVTGAHLYGFPSPDSDYDLRGAHVLPHAAFGGLSDPRRTIEVMDPDGEVDLDLVSHDLGKFAALLLRPNGAVLEQLASPLVVHSTALHRELLDLLPKIVTSRHARHYSGFGRSQWVLFSKRPTVKALLYVHRALLTGIHLVRTGEVEASLPRLLDAVPLPVARVRLLEELRARKMEGDEKQSIATDELERFEASYTFLRERLEEERDRSPLPAAPSCRDELADLVRAARH